MSWIQICTKFAILQQLWNKSKIENNKQGHMGLLWPTSCCPPVGRLGLLGCGLKRPPRQAPRWRHTHRAPSWLPSAVAALASARRRPWAALPSAPCRGGKGGGFILGLTAPGVVGNDGSPRLLWKNVRKLHAAPTSSPWPWLRAPMTWTWGRWMSERQSRSALRGNVTVMWRSP
jgi:hypothetical protein